MRVRVNSNCLPAEEGFRFNNPFLFANLNFWTEVTIGQVSVARDGFHEYTVGYYPGL
jgi:hypothetical protein